MQNPKKAFAIESTMDDAEWYHFLKSYSFKGTFLN